MIDDLFGEKAGIDLFALTPTAAAQRRSDEAASEIAAIPSAAVDGSFVPNPAYCAPWAAAAAGAGTPAAASLAMAQSQLTWVGRLMGVSIRTKACLDFDLAPIVWKLMAHEAVTVDDVVSVDYKLGQHLRTVAAWAPAAPAGGAGAAAAAAAAGGDDPAAAFAANFAGLRFVMPDVAAMPGASPDAGTPLVPGGATLPVTLANRAAYVSAVVEAVAARYRAGTDLILHGVSCIIPERALRLCTWKELQRLTCGESDIDLVVLRRNTAYDSRGVYSDTHPNIIRFWTVMESLTPEQKRNFVRFAWGRSKLPRGAWPKNYKGEQVKFKIVPKLNSTGLPLAHTCFFLIELPVYPDLETMRSRLTVALTYGATEGFLIA
jgi:hypothetical protein